jgi:hypothetical protein
MAVRTRSECEQAHEQKILLTSVCRPFGPEYGDAPSVGYELLYRQVLRAQGIFSPRTVNIHFGLEYIAENLDAPTVVLQYPSKRELIQELKKGYDYVGVSFLMAVMHKMKETVALIRKYAPNSKIVLGGYGTVLKDDVLKPYGDYICREEGVAFFRRLLGEPEIPMPYKHPLIVSWLKVFGWKVSGTGKIFAGLGCPNGCDFCCTSHFFSRKHIKLLPEGKDIYAVAERYLDLDPSLVFLILDEDFLLNKKRAMEFRECVMQGGRSFRSSRSPASRPSANTPWRKFWRWALTASGSATRERAPITPSNRAGPPPRFSRSFAITASPCWLP